MFYKDNTKIIIYSFIIILLNTNTLFADYSLIIQRPINYVENDGAYICYKDKCRLNINITGDIKKKSCKIYIGIANLVSEKCNPPSLDIENDENIARFEVYNNNQIVWSKEILLFKESRPVSKVVTTITKKEKDNYIKINTSKRDYKKTLNYKISKLKSGLKFSGESRKFNNLVLYFLDNKINITVKNGKFIYKTTKLQSGKQNFSFYGINDLGKEVFIKSGYTKIKKQYIFDINKYYSKKIKNNQNKIIGEKQNFNKNISLNIIDKNIGENIKKGFKNDINNINKNIKTNIILNILYFLLIPTTLLLSFIVLKKKKLLQKG